jgi:hypothetical protein
MEPREAASLPVPDKSTLKAAWELLSPKRTSMDQLLRRGKWEEVIQRVDETLLKEALEMSEKEIEGIRKSVDKLRSRRMGV